MDTSVTEKTLESKMKNYTPPELVDYGNLITITQSGQTLPPVDADTYTGTSTGT